MDFAEARRIIAAFERHEVAYVVVGSMAMAAKGIARATRDMDVFVAPDEVNVGRLRAALRDLFGDPAIESQDRLDASVLKERFGLEDE